MTATAANLSGARTLHFTAAEVISLAWKAGRCGELREEPDATEQEWGRKWMNVKLQSLAAKAHIARQVTREEIALTASDADYDLDATVYDVLEGDAVYKDSNNKERAVVFMGRDEYNRIVFKTTEGVPTRFYPRKQAVITVFPWPVPSQAGTLIVQAVRWHQDVTQTTQTIDTEKYFMEYFIKALGHEYAAQKGIAEDHVNRLERQSESLLKMALGQAKQRGRAQFYNTHRTGWTTRY